MSCIEKFITIWIFFSDSIKATCRNWS